MSNAKWLNQKDKHMTRQSLIQFYQKLLHNGTLEVGGAGHRRLLQIQGVHIGANGKPQTSFKDAVSRYLSVKK